MNVQKIGFKFGQLTWEQESLGSIQ